MQTTMIIIGILIILFSIYIYKTYSKVKNAPLAANDEKIIILTESNFKKELSNKTVLVDFWASWCVPCRMMAPVLNEVSKELKGNNFVGKVNIEEHQSLAQKYKIKNIPTFILFKNGIEVNRFIGAKTKDFLIKQIENA
jgi:thioredoxin 1